MIVEFFLAAVFVGIIFLLLGIKLDISVGFIGCGILFLTGAAVIISPLALHVSDNVETSYTYLNATTGVLNSSNQLLSPQYATFSDTAPGSGIVLNHILGLLLSIGSIVALVALVFRREKRET